MPGAAGQEAHQGRLAHHGDTATTLMHQRDVPDELQRIAQPLLGMDEDGPPVQGGAVPEGGAERRQSAEFLALPSPFVTRPSVLELAHLEPGQRLIPMRLGIVRLEADRLLIARVGLVEPALLPQCDAEVVVGIGKVGLEADGPLVARHGLREPVLLFQDAPQVVVGIGIVGLEADGPLKTGRGLLEIVLPRQHDAQVVLHIGVVGLEADDPPIARHGVVELVLPGQAEPQVVVGAGRVGVEMEGPLIARHRLVELVLPRQHLPEIVMGIEIVGLESGGPLIARDGVVQLVLPRQHDAEVVMAFRIVGLEPECLLVARDGIVELALLLQNVPQVVVGIGIVGLEVDGLLETHRGLVEPALLRQHDPLIVLGPGAVGPEPAGLLMARRVLVEPVLPLRREAELEVDEVGTEPHRRLGARLRVDRAPLPRHRDLQMLGLVRLVRPEPQGILKAFSRDTEPALHRAGPAVDVLRLVGVGGMMVPPSGRRHILKLRHGSPSYSPHLCRGFALGSLLRAEAVARAPPRLNALARSWDGEPSRRATAQSRSDGASPSRNHARPFRDYRPHRWECCWRTY
jgi:hypothetical protein